MTESASLGRYVFPRGSVTAIKLRPGAQVFSLLFRLYHMKARAFTPNQQPIFLNFMAVSQERGKKKLCNL